MEDKTAAIIVWCTAPDTAVADTLASTLVQEGLAACVHVFPAGQSIYTWEGKLEKNVENVLMIKSRQPLYPQLQTRLRELHPYQVPEILMVPVRDGLPDYLSWLVQVTPGPENV
ncbi:MAG: divalent-cation tolerance protein CutA [Magnetococcales bacterium]|nr:divalent-cation tolerance protein CutA [Magnetococcales bacterium]